MVHEERVHGTGKELEVLGLAAAVERNSTHPLARAVEQAADEYQCARWHVDEGSFRQVPGGGAEGVVHGRFVKVGTLDWVYGIETGDGMDGAVLSKKGAPKAPYQQAKGETLAFVAIDGELAGALAFVDTLRPEAKAAVAALHQMRLKVAVVSGDRQHDTGNVGGIPSGHPRDRGLLRRPPRRQG